MSIKNHSTFSKVIKWFKKENESKVFSDTALRITVGLLGILLPLSLVFYMKIRGDCNPDILPSISDYFHSPGRDVFIGVLSAVCLAFFVFKGYETIDEFFGKIACISCMGIMLFPTNVCKQTGCHLNIADDTLMNVLHFTSAGIFFGCLVVFSLFLFPLSYKEVEPHDMTKRMKNRKRIYMSCGIIMISCMVAIVVFSNLPDYLHNKFIQYNPTFWMETVMLSAFSFSWFTKSQYWWPDEEIPIKSMIAAD